MIRTSKPSQWVVTHIKHIPEGGQVLDLACGSGRHTRYLLEIGFRVTAVDKDVSRITDLESNTRCCIVRSDLENANPWPFVELFDGIVVTNYLHRPLFKILTESLAVGGVLIYETFMSGNEQYGKPRNPDFLLNRNELSDVFGKSLNVIDFQQGYTARPNAAIMQQICASN